MDEIVGALADQQSQLDGLLRGLDDEAWVSPTPCAGWSVADVVLHVAQSDEMAIGAVEGRFDEVLSQLLEGAPPAGTIDDGAAVMVDVDPMRGDGPAAAARWRAGAARFGHLLRAADPSERVQWVAGRLSVRTLATTRLAETWIHTGDVAEALGQTLEPGERLEHVARLAWRTLPYAFERAGRPAPGPIAFHLTGPSGRAWSFDPDQPAATTISGPGADLCAVAGRRVDPARTGLVAEGPDGVAVLELVRTYA